MVFEISQGVFWCEVGVEYGDDVMGPPQPTHVLTGILFEDTGKRVPDTPEFSEVWEKLGALVARVPVEEAEPWAFADE